MEASKSTGPNNDCWPLPQDCMPLRENISEAQKLFEQLINDNQVPNAIYYSSAYSEKFSHDEKTFNQLKSKQIESASQLGRQWITGLIGTTKPEIHDLPSTINVCHFALKELDQQISHYCTSGFLSIFPTEIFIKYQTVIKEFMLKMSQERLGHKKGEAFLASYELPSTARIPITAEFIANFIRELNQGIQN